MLGRLLQIPPSVKTSPKLFKCVSVSIRKSRTKLELSSQSRTVIRSASTWQKQHEKAGFFDLFVSFKEIRYLELEIYQLVICWKELKFYHPLWLYSYLNY